MAPNPDVVVIGAGHNGLVAAALLAKDGRSVTVLERAAEVGGSSGAPRSRPGSSRRGSRTRSAGSATRSSRSWS